MATNPYCVYLTIYSGNKLPPFYIGSTSLEKIERGYCGSVHSNMYKRTFNKERRLNPQLFKTVVIAQFKTRKEAFTKEQQLQEILSVHLNDLYMNKSIANVAFNNQGNKHSEKSKQLMSNAAKNRAKHPRIGTKHSDETRLKLIKSSARRGAPGTMTGRKHNEDTRKRMSQAKLNDPEYLNRVSKAGKASAAKRANDPNYKRQQSEKMKQIWAERKKNKEVIT